MQVLQIVISGRPSRSASARMRTLSVWKPTGSMARSSRAPVQVAEFQLRELEAEPGRHLVRGLVELGAGRARRASRIVGEFHGWPLRPSRRAAAAAAGVLRLQERLDRVDLAAQQQPQHPRQVGSTRKSLHAQHQRARIDAAARATIARSACGCFAIAGSSAAAFAFNGSITRLTIGMLGRADLLALVAGDAMEDAGARQRAGDLRVIVARIERGLAELDQRRRAGEIGEVAEPDHRAGRVAAHAADAIERLRGVLHVLVGERLGKSRIRRGPLDPGLELGDLALERRAIDHQIAHDRQVAQRLDRHVGLDRLPARQHLAAVHAHRAGAAHLRAAEPAVGEIAGLVLGDPVERVEHAHPFPIGDLEFLELRRSVGAANPHRQHVADREPGIARRERVVLLDLAEPARVADGERRGPMTGASLTRPPRDCSW